MAMMIRHAVNIWNRGHGKAPMLDELVDATELDNKAEVADKDTDGDATCDCTGSRVYLDGVG